MLKILKNEKFKDIVYILVNLILGILFNVLLATMLNFVESIFCVCLLGVGTILIVFYSFLPSDEKIPKLFLFGIIGIACGLFILIWPRFFGIILSIIVVLGGTSLILDSLKVKKSKSGIWLTDFIVGIVVCVLSIVTIILSGTNVAKNILSIFFGCIFLIQGIYGLIEFIKKEKNNKTNIKVEENVSENNENITNEIESLEDKTEKQKTDEIKTETAKTDKNTPLQSE